MGVKEGNGWCRERVWQHGGRVIACEWSLPHLEAIGELQHHPWCIVSDPQVVEASRFRGRPHAGGVHPKQLPRSVRLCPPPTHAHARAHAPPHVHRPGYM
eukprot:scaffold2063_cov401-Prasinococcus_capsulatus_cf.AAC.20